MIVTLTNLAKQKVDVEEYGLKADGLAELIRMNPGEYRVDPGFAVGKSISIRDCPELKTSLLELMTGQNEPRLLIARSSDENEAPGIFESHTFMFSPGNFEQCYADFIDAAEKVRASGAGGVVCQMMETRLSDVEYRGENWEKLKRKCFGVDRVGFVYNSWSPFFEQSPVINSACGLVTKIVRGQDRKNRGISIIFDSYNGLRPINPTHNYRTRHFGEYEQNELDVVFPENPKQVVHQEVANSFQGWPILNLGTTPLYPEFVERLFSILERLKTDGREIEIEGDVSDEMFNPSSVPHLFQLRRYNLPQSRLEKISEIDASRIIFKSDKVYAADKFVGDLVLLNKMGIWPSSPGKIVFAPDYHSIHYGLEQEKTQEFVRNAVENKVRGLIIPVASTGRRYARAAHEIGLMIEELWTLQKEIPVIALDGLSGLQRQGEELARRFPGRVEKKDYGIIIKNITTESDGQEGQIYVN